MLKILNNNLAKVKVGLEECYQQRRNASIESIGGIENRINDLKKEFKKLTKEIEEEEKNYKSPKNAKIYLYIIVTTKAKVAQNVTDECFCHINENRYHATDLEQWRPFSEQQTIGEVVADLKKSYPLFANYLNRDKENGEYAVEIEDNESNAIGIIDLLSINEENEGLAKCFDRTNVKGLLLPECREMTKHDTLYGFMKDKREKVFRKLQTRISRGASCTNYLFSLSEYDDFYRRLLHIFKKTSPIINKSTTNSKTEGLTINMEL